jgi:hypothetical protein
LPEKVKEEEERRALLLGPGLCKGKLYSVMDSVKVLVKRTINPTWSNDYIMEFPAILVGPSY